MKNKETHNSDISCFEGIRNKKMGWWIFISLHLNRSIQNKYIFVLLKTFDFQKVFLSFSVHPHIDTLCFLILW